MGISAQQTFGKRQQVHRHIFEYGLIVLMLVLPFNLLWSSWVFIALFVNWVIEGGFSQKIKRLFGDYRALYFIAFFFLHVLSFFYTQNTGAYGGHLEKKLALFGYPLLLASVYPLSEKHLNMLFRTFVFAMFVAMLVCLGGAWLNYQKFGNITVFFYHELSQMIGLNAIYMATYLSFAAFIVLHALFGARKALSTGKQLGYLMLFLFQLIFLFLLSSKTILISFPLLLNIFLALYFMTQKNYRLLLGLLVLNLLFVSLFVFFDYPKERFKKVFATDLAVVTKEKLSYEENNGLTGVSIRLLMWRFAVESLQEQRAWFLGLGIGDAQEALDEKIAAANLYTGEPKRGDRGYLGYNCHNQYMEFFLILGVLGLVYWLGYLGITLFHAFQYRDYLFLFFIVLVSILCLTESFLETNKGVVFFNLFVGLFIFHKHKKT